MYTLAIFGIEKISCRLQGVQNFVVHIKVIKHNPVANCFTLVDISGFRKMQGITHGLQPKTLTKCKLKVLFTIQLQMVPHEWTAQASERCRILRLDYS